ncbi:MAG TPA: 5-bromo-4-chloroindolyl phosphate hydrolysis family protein [Thermoleophilia bacterium]|nr:5-bromo-4-chloroindolyl phosphate hydrolysis family protein [Thermoleophilia bacterium]
MPLGGYCRVCDRWVWLTPYGECQNGHPASAMRDVQQLTSQSGSVSVVERPRPMARRARFRWWWRHSLWVAWTFTGGLMNWAAFVYIGVRAQHLPWALLGFVYLMPLILTILAIGTPLLQVMIALQLVVSVISVANALYLRPYYRAIMFGDTPPRSLPAPPQPPPLLSAAQRPTLPKGIDEAAADVLQPAHAQVDTLLEHATAIGKADVREAVVALCRTADQIIAELASHPRRLDAARGFLTYYLDAAQRIVEGYVYLGSRQSSSPEIDKTIARAEDSLHVVQQAFDRQLANVLEDRALDLDSEIELLERTVRSETMYTRTGEQQ